MIEADPTRLGVSQAGAAMRRGELTAVTLTEAYLARIQRVDPAIRAYITVTADVARAQAMDADQRRSAGEDGPLLGIPYALKDIFTTAGITTTAGSRMLADYVPPDSSTVYERLRAAGAVLLGKTNMDEFAMGSSTENSAFFATRNPWDLARVPGGSSGGSAAAVAAGLCAFAMGTDTGGSIRQPASLCGVVGLKPTYGRVSRYGLIAFASSLDQAGPLARSAGDVAVVLEAISGHDERDATCLDAQPGRYAELFGLGDGHLVAKPGGTGPSGPSEPIMPDNGWERWAAGDLTGLKVGVPAEFFAKGLDDAVKEVVEEAIERIVAAGATRVPVELPHAPYGVATYYVVATAEASANLARYDGVRYGYAATADDVWTRLARTRGQGFGAEVKRRILLGTYVLSSGYYDAYYVRATSVRRLIRQDFERAFARCDIIAGPTSPTTAFPLGSRLADPLSMYLADVYTIGLPLAGLPGLSMPCGLAGGLPVGLQLMAPALGEPQLLATACGVERLLATESLRPPMPWLE